MLILNRSMIPLRMPWTYFEAISALDCAAMIFAWESYNEAATGALTRSKSRIWISSSSLFTSWSSRILGDHTIIINSPVGNLGWPGEPSPADFKRSLALDGTIVSFHGYEYHQAPANDRQAYLFRWKTLREQVLAKFPK